MGTQISGNMTARQTVEGILAEIFAAYQEAGNLYVKTSDAEIRQTLLEMKRCFDLAITLLSPLDAPSEGRFDNLRAPFITS